VDIITNFGVGASVGTDNGFQRTVEAGRKSEVRGGADKRGRGHEEWDILIEWAMQPPGERTHEL
jgi:hypothetical protein